MSLTSDSPAPARPAQDEPRLKHVRSHGQWQGTFVTALTVRRFDPFYTAEPEAVGGDDRGPTPMEYVAAALNGCLAVTIETVAQEQGVRLDGIDLDVVATMDTRGFYGTADVSPHFLDLTSTVTFTSPDDPGFLDALRPEVERRCPALNLVRDAGTTVVLDWTVTAGEQVNP